MRPPADVAPGRLFRALLTLPRPVERLSYRMSAAPGVALSVRALTAVEWAEAADVEDDGLTLVSLALVGRSGAPLASVDDLGELTDTEFGDLRTEVYAALQRISPTYRHSDTDAWAAVLRRGAEQQHASLVMTMGTCMEQVGRRVVEAPEKFFGVPRGALLDGHWMAFRAAQHVYETRRPKG